MDLIVYSNTTRYVVATINEYTYVTYTQELRGRGSFEIHIPTTEKSLEFIVFGAYIGFGTEAVGIVKGRRDSENNDSEVVVYGYMSNHILEYRSFLVTAKYYDYINKIATQMVSDNFCLNTLGKRKISFVSQGSAGSNIGDKIRVQNTGDTIYCVLYYMLEPDNLGFDMVPVYGSNNGEYISNFTFTLIRPVDRTVGNTQGNLPVVFSFDLDNLQTLEYESDGREYCNVAVVASEGTGEERTVIEVGDTDASGINRIELYVDARDLQSGVTEEFVVDYVDEQFGELLNGEY